MDDIEKVICWFIFACANVITFLAIMLILAIVNPYPILMRGAIVASAILIADFMILNS